MNEDTLRDRLEASLSCPSCGSTNSVTLRIVKLETLERVWCSQCGHSGPIAIFQIKEK